MFNPFENMPVFMQQFQLFQQQLVQNMLNSGQMTRASPSMREKDFVRPLTEFVEISK